jgi:hypothetical protein
MLKLRTLVVMSMVTVNSMAAPEISFSGYLDADVWVDLRGSYFTNSELDLGLSLQFNPKISAHVYTTVNSVYSLSGQGQIPAGAGLPSERWIEVHFDGFDITWESKIGTFKVGDLVYQYGKFNYYFYKRLSMITKESFTRGLSYGLGNEKIRQEITAGVADVGDNVADLHGLTGVNLNENHSLELYYGMRGSSLEEISSGTDFFAGAHYLGSIGDYLSVKADVGYTSIGGTDRGNVLSLLLEPSLTFNRFSLAFTGYALFDPDSVNELADDPLFGIADELMFYVEPGYSFNEKFAAGLPLEYHGADLENKDDNAFWAVPTFYIYPAENIQWWLWGQVVGPLSDGVKGKDLLYGIGSEIIVEF